MKTIFNKFLIMTIIAGLLSSCAAPVPLSHQDKQDIYTVMIDKNIKFPYQLSYLGVNHNNSLMGEGYGATEDINNERSRVKLQKFADANNVNIDRIVFDQFAYQIKKYTKFKVVKYAPTDAVLQIEVHQYGLSAATPYSTVVSPVISLNAQLIKDNQIVWSNNYYVDPSSQGMPRHSIKKFENNPQLLYHAWDMAAQKAIRNIIATLR